MNAVARQSAAMATRALRASNNKTQKRGIVNWMTNYPDKVSKKMNDNALLLPMHPKCKYLTVKFRFLVEIPNINGILTFGIISHQLFPHFHFISSVVSYYYENVGYGNQKGSNEGGNHAWRNEPYLVEAAR